jgi:site-specific DNA recombinase
MNLSTPQGRLMFRQKGSWASFEIEQKARRQKAANRQRAKAGNPWVTRPFGYTMKVDKEAAVARAQSKAYFAAIDTGKSEAKATAEGIAAAKARALAWNPITDSTDNDVVKYEADAIRKACRDLLNGASLWSIAAQWNSVGLKTSKGCTWTGGQVRQVLLRPRNAGLQVYDGEVMDNVVPLWPAIVKRQTWELVCKVLADPKRHTGKSPGRKHLLSGIAICGACRKPIGSGARGTKANPNRVVYQCKRIGCMKIVRDLVQTDEVWSASVPGWLSRT